MISWRMAAAWIAALVLTTALTWQIVGLADSQVGENPAAVAPLATTSSVVDSATTTRPSTTTTTIRTTTSTVGTTSSSSGTSGSAAGSSSTSSTSTTTEAEWSVRTINSVGGSVVARFRPGQVELQAAIPAPGFAVEIDDNGPDRVRVEFESDDLEVRVEVRWENGDLDIRIDEND